MNNIPSLENMFFPEWKLLRYNTLTIFDYMERFILV